MGDARSDGGYVKDLPTFAWDEDQLAVDGPRPGHADSLERPNDPLVLAIPTLQAGQFHNLEDVMLHAAFAVLRQFLESEFPGHVRWRQAHVDELEELYSWWQRNWMRLRPGTDDEYAEDDEMFTRLVRIRHIMWT